MRHVHKTFFDRNQRRCWFQVYLEEHFEKVHKFHCQIRFIDTSETNMIIVLYIEYPVDSVSKRIDEK